MKLFIHMYSFEGNRIILINLFFNVNYMQL